MAVSGLAKPWLDFEQEIGMRPRLRGPIDKVDEQYNEIGAILVKKLTFPSPDTSVKTEDKEISPNLKVRIYTPPGYAGNRPVCVFYHSGGWAMGDLEGEDAAIRTMAKNAGIVIVSTDYRLAPKHVYPAGLDDCVAAYRWSLANSTYLNTTPGQAITCGTSAGGNLAISAALRVIDAGDGQTLKGVVAIAPVTIAPEAVPEKLKSNYTSYSEHDENTINTKSAMLTFFDAYKGESTDAYVSPLLHPRIKDLPKTYISWAGQDTLRDDGRLFQAALNDAGVPNLSDEYDGYPHFFWSFPSKHLAEAIADYEDRTKRGFEFVLA